MKRLLFAALAAASLPVAEVATRVTIAAGEPGHAVSPLLHGIFFEDITYAADGGLYAELVQNRSFEHAESLYAWSLVNRGAQGGIDVSIAEPLDPKNPHYLRLEVANPGQGFGVANGGYGGIAAKQDENHFFSVRARADAAFRGANGALRVVLEDETGRPPGECQRAGLAAEWKKFEGTITSAATAAHARLVVLATAAGCVDLDVVSLFPEHTFRGRRTRSPSYA